MINAITERFKIYYTITDDDVPLPLRVTCIHPQHGHLTHLNIEQRDKVWNAVLQDAEYVVTRNSDVRLRCWPITQSHSVVG